MREMTGLERCLTVLEGGVADRVPVVPQTFMFAAQTAGIKVGELARSAARMVPETRGYSLEAIEGLFMKRHQPEEEKA